MPKYIDAEKLEKDGWSASRTYQQDAKTMVYETKKMTDFPTADVPDTNVGDTISRQAAIDALDKRFDSIPMEQTTEILLLRKDLRNLPAAQPTQLEIDMAYMRGKVDGINECKDKLKRLKESINV